MFFRLFCTAFLVGAWTHAHQVGRAELGVVAIPSPRELAIGVVAGSLLVGLRLIYVKFFLGSVYEPKNHAVGHGPMFSWIVIFFLGGVVEEVWRGSSIWALEAVGAGATIAVLGSATAFLFAHLAGIPARIPGEKKEALWEGIVGAALAILFIATGTIVVSYCASIVYFSLISFSIRRHITSQTG
jgi:hypothetical protein